MSEGYSDYLESYVPVLAIIVVGLGLVVAMMLGNRLLRPSRPTAGQAAHLRVRRRPGRHGLGAGPRSLLRLCLPVRRLRRRRGLPVSVGHRLRAVRLGHRRGDGCVRRHLGRRPCLRVAQGGPDVDVTPHRQRRGRPAHAADRWILLPHVSARCRSWRPSLPATSSTGAASIRSGCSTSGWPVARSSSSPPRWPDMTSFGSV